MKSLKKNIKSYSHQKKKKTGYERVPKSDIYFYTYSNGCVETDCEDCYNVDDEYYESANYYSDKTVAENNARADNLMRQLRRFSVEHRGRGVNLNDANTKKFYIRYDYECNELEATFTFVAKVFGIIYFDSEEAVNAAIDEFHDELIWYFTEYKDSL